MTEATPNKVEALAGLADKLEKRGEGMTADEVLPLLRPAEKRALLAMSDEYRTPKEIGTNGRVMWELADFRRDFTGVAPPTVLVGYDEEYGWRGWALSRLGRELQNTLRAQNAQGIQP